MRPRVILADDYPLMLKHLLDLVSSELDVLATAPDGEALLAAAATLHPDLVVLDISMPRMDGITAARKLLRTRPGTRIVFLTVHQDPELIETCLALGPVSYVLKSRLACDLLPAVRDTLAGRPFISPLPAHQA